MIKKLEWESWFFKLKIGAVFYSLSDVSALMDEKVNNSFKRVFYFSYKRDLNIERQIIDKNGYLADIKIIYHQKIGYRKVDGNIIDYSGECTEALKKLAIQSGHESRFRRDPLLSGYFEKMYTTWIEKSLSKELADVVLVYITDNFIKGFVTLSFVDEIGTIGLISVDNSYRGMGIGKALINASIQWMFLSGCVHIEVATQFKNKEACKFYEKNGFLIKEKKYIYHL